VLIAGGVFRVLRLPADELDGRGRCLAAGGRYPMADQPRLLRIALLAFGVAFLLVYP